MTVTELMNLLWDVPTEQLDMPIVFQRVNEPVERFVLDADPFGQEAERLVLTLIPEHWERAKR